RHGAAAETYDQGHWRFTIVLCCVLLASRPARSRDYQRDVRSGSKREVRFHSRMSASLRSRHWSHPSQACTSIREWPSGSAKPSTELLRGQKYFPAVLLGDQDFRTCGPGGGPVRRPRVLGVATTGAPDRRRTRRAPCLPPPFARPSASTSRPAR